MKLTTKKLKQLIREELSILLEEQGGMEDDAEAAEAEEDETPQQAIKRKEYAWDRKLRQLKDKYKNIPPTSDKRALAFDEYNAARKEYLKWRKSNLGYEQ